MMSYRSIIYSLVQKIFIPKHNTGYEYPILIAADYIKIHISLHQYAPLRSSPAGIFMTFILFCANTVALFMVEIGKL